MEQLWLSSQLFYEDVFYCNTSFGAKQLMDLNQVLHSIRSMKMFVEAFWKDRLSYDSAEIQHPIGRCRCSEVCSAAFNACDAFVPDDRCGCIILNTAIPPLIAVWLHACPCVPCGQHTLSIHIW